MQKLSRGLVFVAAVMGVGAATPALAQNLKLSMANGRVTLVAQDVPLRLILAEWARVGDTRIVNGDKVVGPAMTLELIDYPEGRALDLLLREAAGYMAAPRPADQPGASVYDRILILATSRPPTVTAAAPPPAFNRNLMPQPMPVPVDDEDREPGDQGPVPPPGMVTPGMPTPGPQPQPYPAGMQSFPPGAQPFPPGTQSFPPGMQPGPQQQPVLTAPRPGQLPQPQPGVPNPYAPGARPQGPPGRPPGGESSGQ